MFGQIVMMTMMSRMVNMVTKTMFFQTPAKVAWVNKNLPEAGRVFAALGGIQKGSFVDTLRVTKGPAEVLIRPHAESVVTRVFVYYRGKLREATDNLTRLPLTKVAGDMYRVAPSRGQRVWLTSYDKLWGGSWSKVDIIINNEDLIAPLEEAKTAAKAPRPLFGGVGGRRAGQAVIDIETGKVYHSKSAAGKLLGYLVDADPKDTFAWYKLTKGFPGRFRLATEGELGSARAKGEFYQV